MDRGNSRAARVHLGPLRAEAPQGSNVLIGGRRTGKRCGSDLQLEHTPLRASVGWPVTQLLQAPLPTCSISRITLGMRDGLQHLNLTSKSTQRIRVKYPVRPDDIVVATPARLHIQTRVNRAEAAISEMIPSVTILRASRRAPCGSGSRPVRMGTGPLSFRRRQKPSRAAPKQR